MTSFASAFGSSDHDPSHQNSSSVTNSNGIPENKGLNHFSSVDLDQQSNSPQHRQHSSYVSLSDAATYHPDSSSNLTTTNIPRNPPLPSQDLTASTSFSSNAMINTSSVPVDRRISVPDVSKLTASSAAAVAAVGPTIDKLKQWSRSTYKCTKQTIFEKLGKTTRTVDTELDSQIEQLKDTKRRYENMLALARSYANHFSNLLQTQRTLSDTFVELQQKSFHLSDEFSYNAETQRLLARNGEILMNALNYFISSLHTLCSKTIEDTMDTIRLYETARLEYDACRNEIELLPAGPQLHSMQREFQQHKDKFEKLKCDVSIKLKFLDENQTKVMKKQLLLFHNAIAAYFSGNQTALEATVKQFNLKIIANGDERNSEKKSFLEQHPHH